MRRQGLIGQVKIKNKVIYTKRDENVGTFFPVTLDQDYSPNSHIYPSEKSYFFLPLFIKSLENMRDDSYS